MVAALTVPTLIVKYQKEQTVTRLKKTYSALSQTTQRAIADYGPMSTWEISDTNLAEDNKIFFNKYMAPYLSLSKPVQSKAEGNWDAQYWALNGSPANYGNSCVRAYFSDGSSVTFYRWSSTAKRFNFYIDINGDKKPNKLGRDIFEYDYYLDSSSRFAKERLAPCYYDLSRSNLLDNTKYRCNKNQEGNACAALIMKDGWQLKDDYPW